MLTVSIACANIELNHRRTARAACGVAWPSAIQSSKFSLFIPTAHNLGPIRLERDAPRLTPSHQAAKKKKVYLTQSRQDRKENPKMLNAYHVRTVKTASSFLSALPIPSALWLRWAAWRASLREAKKYVQ